MLPLQQGIDRLMAAYRPLQHGIGAVMPSKRQLQHGITAVSRRDDRFNMASGRGVHAKPDEISAFRLRMWRLTTPTTFFVRSTP
jgi:hypothetical protein